MIGNEEKDKQERVEFSRINPDRLGIYKREEEEDSPGYNSLSHED